MYSQTIAPLALLMACTAQIATAEGSDSPGFSGFGTWQAECDAWGVAAECRSTWRPGLSPDHVIQDYSITKAGDPSQIFAGRGLYRISGDTVTGGWEDSRGAILELAGTYESGRLRVIWGSAQDEIGRSIYIWNEAALTAQDSVLTDQGWRDFMVIEYPAP
nr:hypothetical protein [Hyphomonas sp. Mor2]